MLCLLRRWVLVLTVLASASPSAWGSVTLTNSDFTVEVNGGDANNGVGSSNGYFRFFIPSLGEETTWSVDPILILPTGATVNLADGSAGGFGTPFQNGNSAVSATTIGDVTVVAETILDGNFARTTFTFEALTLEGYKLVFFAENDIGSFSDDIATFTGSIADGNLRLFQPDNALNQLSVELNGTDGFNAKLRLFGSGLYSGFGSALDAADLSVLSDDGSNFVTGPGDLGLALAYDLSGRSASFQVNYGVTVIPEAHPMLLLSAAVGLLAGYRRLTRPARKPSR